jgi:CheY-like chemotaxis protein
MSESLNVIIVDDDPEACEALSKMIASFYEWGEVLAFTDHQEAASYCRTAESSLALFVLDFSLGKETAFGFLDTVIDRYPMAREDAIIITENLNDQVVNKCIDLDITYLLEKPIKSYALQLAIRAIVAKYVRFAKKILQDSEIADSVSKF